MVQLCVVVFRVEMWYSMGRAAKQHFCMGKRAGKPWGMREDGLERPPAEAAAMSGGEAAVLIAGENGRRVAWPHLRSQWPMVIERDRFCPMAAAGSLSPARAQSCLHQENTFCSMAVIAHYLTDL